MTEQEWKDAVECVCEDLDEGMSFDGAIDHTAELFRCSARKLVQEFNLRTTERYGAYY